MLNQFDTPWPYILTDEILDNELLSDLEDLAMVRIASGKFGLLYEKEMSFIDLTEYQRRLRALFPEFNSYEIHTHLAVQKAEYIYRTHCDHPDKVASVITYIYPESGMGTLLHSSEDGPAVSECTWKPGHTLVFANDYGKTWHSYRSGGRSPRVTLNTFFVKPGTNPTGRPE